MVECKNVVLNYVREYYMYNMNIIICGFWVCLIIKLNGIFMFEILRLLLFLYNYLYDLIYVIVYRNSIMINVVIKYGKKRRYLK